MSICVSEEAYLGWGVFVNTVGCNLLVDITSKSTFTNVSHTVWLRPFLIAGAPIFGTPLAAIFVLTISALASPESRFRTKTSEHCPVLVLPSPRCVGPSETRGGGSLPPAAAFYSRSHARSPQTKNPGAESLGSSLLPTEPSAGYGQSPNKDSGSQRI